MDQAKLIELRDHSVFVGSDPDLVQASGGNTSWKSGSTVFVKGSGKRLKDALSEDIFSIINFDSLAEDEIATCQDFSCFKLYFTID
jgi:rhamnose utilization protein RhaD (predicted bifunctional aldolase and dehydrogenase)